MSSSWDDWKGSGIRWHDPGKPDIYLFGDRSEFWEQEDPNSVSEEVVAQNTLMDEVYAIARSRALRSNSIELFRAGIQHVSRDLRINHVIWTCKFSHYFDELRSVLSELMSHPKAQVRLSIIQGLGPLPAPETESSRVLTMGLNDKSKPVRTFSLQQIREHDQKHLVHVLSERLSLEKDPDQADELRKVIAIFSNGYFVEHHPEDPMTCTIHHGANYDRFEMNRAEATPEKIRARLDALGK